MKISTFAPYSRNHLTLPFDVDIPFTILRGTGPLPRVIILAGIHGDEYEGVAALQELARELDPSTIKGTLTIVPVANPQAFAAGLRHNPIDDGDLNRKFPGTANGSVSDRLASIILDDLVDGNDAMLSLHGWSKEALVIPYGEYPLGDSIAAQTSKACAYQLGFEYLHAYHWPEGVLGNSALERGVAAVETEIGGQGTITAEGQARTRDVIFRFLRFWRLLASEDHPLPKTPRNVSHRDIFAESPGLFRSFRGLADTVSEGTVLGHLTDISGRVVCQFHAPVSGIIAILRTFASVQTGDRLFQIFCCEQAQQLPC